MVISTPIELASQLIDCDLPSGATMSMRLRTKAQLETVLAAIVAECLLVRVQQVLEMTLAL